jgi:hypothetical protein
VFPNNFVQGGTSGEKNCLIQCASVIDGTISSAELIDQFVLMLDLGWGREFSYTSC